MPESVECSRLPLRQPESLNILQVRLGGVLCGKPFIRSVVESRAADWNRANRKLTLVNPYVHKRLRNESPIPATRFIVPGANDNASLYHDHPDWYEAMIARANVQVLGRLECGEGSSRESLWRRSFRCLCRFAVSRCS